MKQNKTKRCMALLLTVLMMLTTLPVSALAEAAASSDTEPVLCSVTEGCTLEDGHEGDCVPASAEGEDKTEVNPAEGNAETPDATPNGEENPAETEPEQETPSVELTAEEKLAELIAALPAPEDIDPENEEQAEAVHNQIEAIYAFAAENDIDVDGNEIINAVIATLNPADTLDENTISTDTIWNDAKTISENLTVNSGVTLTINASVTIAGNVTISGGGTIIASDNFTSTNSSMILLAENASLSTNNITLNANGKSRVLLVGNQSTLTVNDGTVITGGKAPTENSKISGGGIYIDWLKVASVYIKGGKITGNSCSSGRDGGGVYISGTTGTIFEMTGGEISGNSGGGLAIHQSVNHAIMTGGKVINNTEYGVKVNNCNLVVGDTLEITGNKKADGTDCNLHLGATPYNFKISSALKNDIGIFTNYYIAEAKTMAEISGTYTITESDLEHLKVGGVANDKAVLDYPLFLVDNKIVTRNVAFVTLKNGADTVKVCVPVNETYTLPTEGFENGSYTLSGWAKAGETTCTETFTPVDAGSTYSFSAMWVSTIIFDSNGGTLNSGAAAQTMGTVKQGDTISKSISYYGFAVPKVDDRIGYTHDEWYTAAKDGDSVGEWNVIVPTGKTTYYAHWTPNTYTVSLDANGGVASGTATSITAKYDESFALPSAHGFTNGSKHFAGWATTQNGEVAYVNGETVINLTAEKDATVTLYAVWVDKDFVASIDDAEYVSLADAVKAAKDGDTITLIKDVEISEPINIAKEITLNLNGKTISSGTTQIWKGDNWSLISVRSGGKLTINGAGTLQTIENDCYAVDVRDGALCTINGGEYIGNIHAVYVYEGSLTVNGGKFSVQQVYPYNNQDYQFVLNCFDANRANETATISVTGGEFCKFNPQNCEAEGKGTNFAKDCCVKADGDWYKVNAKHTEVIDAAKAATCTVTGLTEGKHCSVCDTVLAAQETIAAKGHSYTDVVTKPTCTEKGYTTHTCANCTDSYNDAETEATGHSYGEWETVTSPGCTDKGSQKRTCTACEVTETKDVDPNGHDWEENFTVDKQPTATEDGSKSIHCKNCNVTKDSTVIPALGQQPAKVEAESIPDGKTLVSGAVKEEAKTALESAAKDAFQNEFAGKNVLMVEISLINTATWEADHTEKVTFTVGYPAGINAENFKNYEFVVLHQKADGSMELSSFEATENGLKITSTLSPFAIGYSEKHVHSFAAEWKQDSTNHWKECACGEKSENAAHDFKWVTDKAATATAKGSKHQECSVCGYKTESVVIPATVVPQTGDNSNLVIWLVLLAVSVSGAGALLLITRKRSCRSNRVK